MSQNLGKEFINVGVQSPTEFEVQSNDLQSQSESHKSVVARSIELRVDKVVDTRDSACEFNPQTSRKTFVFKEESFQNSNGSNGTNLRKAKNKKTGMEKKLGDINTMRTTSDLERKKLEAELKATEEIAKLKQSVIEKRLELELASLQDDHPPITRPIRQPKQNDLKMVDGVVHKNSFAEVQQVTSKLKTLPAQAQNPTTVPVQIIPTSFQAHFFAPKSLTDSIATDQVKSKPSKNEFDCLIRKDIKALKLIAKPSLSSDQKLLRPTNFEKNQKLLIGPEKAKFMQLIEKASFSPFQHKKQSSLQLPLNESKEAQMPKMFVEAHYAVQTPDSNIARQPEAERPECSVGVSSQYKNMAMWKNVVSKVKKKLKKTPW